MLQLEVHWLIYGLFSLAIASVHVWFPWFERRFNAYENQWLGFVGGIAIAYVLIYLLPKLTTMTSLTIEMYPDAHPIWHARAYLLMLIGIITYMIIDRLDHPEAAHRNTIGRYLEYSVHGSYSFLAGYLQVEMPRSTITLHMLATVILILHLMGMSHVLQQQRPEGYPSARWFLFACVLLGTTMALTTEFPKAIINVTTAFLCGIILINVVSVELPMGQKRRFNWFLTGIAVFMVIAVLTADRPDPANAQTSSRAGINFELAEVPL